MRYIISILSFLLMAGCASTNRHVEGQSLPEASNPLEERPYVVGWVDGQAVKLGVDTGAAQNTILFSDAVENLGGRLIGRGDMRTTNLDVIIYDGQPELEERQTVAVVPHSGFAGLMGWPLVRQFVWHLNYPDGYHEFTYSTPFWVRNTYSSMELETRDDLPHLTDSYDHKVVIDTGAPFGIYLSDELWKQWKKENPYSFVTLYDGFSPAAGGLYVKECARAKSFVINGVVLRNIIVAQSFVNTELMQFDEDIDIVIGLDAFKSREIWLDGINGRIYFGPEKGRFLDELPLNLTGAVFLPRQEGRFTTYEIYVLENSTAWNAGLRPGDRLLTLNGRRYPDTSLIQYLSTSPGAQVTVQVLRNGKTRRYKWTVPTEESATPSPPASEPDSSSPVKRLPFILEGSPVDGQIQPAVVFPIETPTSPFPKH